MLAPVGMDERTSSTVTSTLASRSKPAAPSPSHSPSTTPDINKTVPASTVAARPLYSSKLSDQLKSRVPAAGPAAAAATAAATTAASDNSSASNNRRPTPPQRAWSGAKNPITGRSQTPQSAPSPQDKHSVTGGLREGQRVRFTLTNGAEYEGTYANNPADSASCYLKMVQQKKGPSAAEIRNGARSEGNMSFQRREVADARVLPNNYGRANEKAYNGNMQAFRTDSGVSGADKLNQRELQPWVPDSDIADDGGLEGKGSGRGTWDQFAVAAAKGLTTDYDENIYTTAINKRHPEYQKRYALAEKTAREIERSVAVTSHVAEERRMDYREGGPDEGGDEEDKYSGVRRDFPPLQSRENKYTPPARRAPTAHSTVKGAPVDPAIISAQLKAPPSQKQAAPKVDEGKAPAASVRTPAPPASEIKVAGAKADAKLDSKLEAKPDTKVNDTAVPVIKTSAASGDGTTEKNGNSLRPSANSSRTVSPPAPQAGGSAAAASAKPTAPNATDTVQQDVVKEFKKFAAVQRNNVELQRTNRARADKEVKLTELRKFSQGFKLSTPVPRDIISIIAKDPEKQKEIQAKAIRDAEEMKTKLVQAATTAPKDKEAPTAAAKDKQAKAPDTSGSGSLTPATTTSSTAATGPADPRNAARPTAPQHSSSPSAVPGRHGGARQSYASQTQYQQHQPYRNNHQGPHMGGQARPQTGNLAQRIKEQHRLHPPHNQHNQQHMGQHVPVDMRVPPTGPANNADASYGARRLSGLAPSHLHQAKLNPSTQEFRPSAFAPAFNPAGPSQGSSPRSAVTHVAEPAAAAPPPSGGQLIRRKTKAVDATKCNILSHLKTLKPKVPNKSWEENRGIPPCFATNPTWRQIEDESKERERKADSTMLITYQEFFEKQPLATAPMATPNPQHTMPTAHFHQLPFHMQTPNPNMPPGQSPRIPPMTMHTAQHGPLPHAPYNPNPDDHRMMHSNSAQSFASPRVTPQMQMAYAPNMNSPAQMPYTQPVMQPYMTAGAPQMNPQFRSFSNNPQFMPQQGQHMGGPGQPPFMMQQPTHFMPNGMMPAPGQMPMYPGGPQYMPQGNGPPPSVAGSNGFPSPGRPAAPMMAHQGSYQGQQMGYPGVQYQQAFVPQQHQNKYPGQRS